MLGWKPGLALAVALSLIELAACAASQSEGSSSGHGGGPSAETPGAGGVVAGALASGGTSSELSGGAGSSGSNGLTGEGGATGVPTAPYANVTAVSATGTDDDYTFNVTVESADIDCSQYADWWEVLGEDGSLVYRRILEHSHTDANGSSDADAPGNTFTRSGGPVPVTDVDVVVVRAHMSVGGYNGAVMRGSVADGFVQATDVGPDFAPGVELEDPQPAGCEF